MDCITGLFYAGIITALVILSFVVAKISENLKRHIKYDKDPLSCWKGDTVYKAYIENMWVTWDNYLALCNRLHKIEAQLTPEVEVAPVVSTVIERIAALETKKGKKSK